MMGISLKQEIESMPEGMAKQIFLKVLNAPKADMEKLQKDHDELKAQFLKDHNLTEFTL